MKNIVFEKKNHIGVIWINRPEVLNALNRESVDEISQCLDEIEKEKDLRVLVFSSDKNFAAGADIKSIVDSSPEQAKAFCFSQTFNRIARLQIPTIAAMEGYALGGGLELALACDFRIASDKTKLGFPEITLGIMPGAGGTVRLPRLIGQSKAMELILFGKIIASDEALDIGLINLIVPPGETLQKSMEWAVELAEKPPIAIRYAKEIIRDSFDFQTVENGVEIEEVQWSRLFETRDQREGMNAFLEKRKPIFLGK